MMEWNCEHWFTWRGILSFNQSMARFFFWNRDVYQLRRMLVWLLLELKQSNLEVQEFVLMTFDKKDFLLNRAENPITSSAFDNKLELKIQLVCSVAKLRISGRVPPWSRRIQRQPEPVHNVMSHRSRGMVTSSSSYVGATIVSSWVCKISRRYFFK